MIGHVIIMLCAVYGIAAVFICCGLLLYRKAIAEDATHPPSLIIGISYFLGMGMFISGWRVLAYFTDNARVALFIAAGSLALWLTISARSVLAERSLIQDLFRRRRGRLAAAVVAAIFLYAWIAITWLEPFERLQPFISLGSLHSGRYANIATYIVENNSIPVLNQNIAQSMLAAVPMMAGINAPHLALTIWLTTSSLLLALTVFGFLRHAGLSNRAAFPALLLVLLGNTALSMTHIAVFDSGGPFLLNGYTDSVFSIGSYLAFVLMLIAFFRSELRSHLVPAITLGMLIVAWNLAAAQNVLLAMATFLCMAGYRKITGTIEGGKALAAICLMLIAAIAGATQGGMLAPQALQDDLALPGVMTFSRGGGIELRLEQPYHTGLGGTLRYGIKDTETKREMMSLLLREGDFETAYNYVQLAERDFVDALRISFFPFLGVISLGYIAARRPDLVQPEARSLVKELAVAVLATFAVGFLVVFLFQVNGYKWELTRFLVPGFALAMMSCMIALFLVLPRFPRFGMLICILAVVSLCGPLVNNISIVVRNATEGGVSLAERVRMLIMLNGYVP